MAETAKPAAPATPPPAEVKTADAPKHQDFPAEAGPKYKMGQVVFHPPALDGSFPAGKGSICDVKQTPDGTKYQIKSDKINKVLGELFKEESLQAAF